MKDFTTHNVSVRNIQPYFESGMNWVEVGGRWKTNYRGELTKKWTSDVTIAGVGVEIGNARAALKLAEKNGEQIKINFAEYESIFGINIPCNSAINCVIIASDNSFDTANLNENAMVEWTFTLLAVDNLYDSTISVSFPRLRIQSVSRLDGTASASFDAETYGTLSGFGFSAPTAEVVYEGDKEDIKKALDYLCKGYETLLFRSYYNVWLFDRSELLSYGTYFKVLKFEYNGQVDKAGIIYSITILFGKDN